MERRTIRMMIGWLGGLLVIIGGLLAIQKLELIESHHATAGEKSPVQTEGGEAKAPPFPSIENGLSVRPLSESGKTPASTSLTLGPSSAPPAPAAARPVPSSNPMPPLLIPEVPKVSTPGKTKSEPNRFQSNDNRSFQRKPDGPARKESSREDRIAGTGVPGAAELEGEQQGQLLLKKILPKEVQVGREESIQILVKNIGTRRAKSIVLREEIPAQTSLVSANPPISPTTRGELIWKNFELGPNEERVFSYVLIPRAEGELGSVASVHFTLEASGRTICTRPVLQVEVNVPDSVVIGENVPVEILISNTGSGAASGVTLVEKVPKGLSHSGGNVLDNRIDSIGPGEAKKLSLMLTSVAPGKVTNLLEVTSDSGFRQEVKSEILVRAPELHLQIVGSKRRYLERESSYTFKIVNPGSATAKNVLLAASIPDNMEFVRTNNLGDYNKETHTVHWELAELPQNITPGEIELVLKPIRIGEGKLSLQGKGEHGLSAECSQEVQVDGLPALSYTVQTMTDPVEVGKEAVYEIRIANRGTKESTNVNIQVLVPDEMKIVRSEGPTSYRLEEGVLVFGTLRSVAAKQEVIYQLRAICSVPGDHRIKIQVSSDDFERLVKEESVRAYY